MKASEAFFKTVAFIMDETDRLCSLGYHKSDMIKGPMSAMLYGIGKFCRYTLGLIISIFAGSIAYGATAFTNWFYYKNEPQQQMESSNPQPQANFENKLISILTSEDLENKIRLSIEKLDSKIPALKSRYEAAQSRYDAGLKKEFEATLQKEYEDLMQEQLLPLELTSNFSAISGEAENINIEKVVIKKLTPKAMKKMIELVFSTTPPAGYRLPLTLESLKKDLENLIQQINPQTTQSELSNISEQYNIILNKVTLFSEINTRKQRTEAVEQRYQDVRSPKQEGLAADKARLFSKRTKNVEITETQAQSLNVAPNSTQGKII